MQSLKQDWIRAQLTAREAEYVTPQPLNVFVGTYNVNGKLPKNKETGDIADLRPWLVVPELPLPDIYVLGFQVCVCVCV